MKLWQYSVLLSAIWLAPVPTTTWNLNLVVGALMAVVGLYYSCKDV